MGNFHTTTNYFRDTDDFAPPPMGGPVGAKTGPIYEGNSTAAALFLLPQNAHMLLWTFNCQEAFNGTTVQTVEVTYPSGTIIASLDCGATGQGVAQATPGSLNAQFNEVQIYGRHLDTVATTGTVWMTCYYMLRDS